VKNEEKMNPKINLKENLASRTIRVVILFLLGLFLLPTSPLKAEDYPVGYLGSGYREYLLDKIHEGFYVETFSRIDLRQKERVNKRNQVEQILTFSSQAMPEASNNILVTGALHKYYSDRLRAEVARYNRQRTQVASAQGVFTYLPHSDGKVEYFKDGLVDHIVNERVVDEFGNTNLKNTYNMKYNDSRMITGYDADVKDNLGNISRLFWYGAEYTSDSVSYGTAETNANKNLREYFIKEIDPAGNTRLTHFQALNFEGKLLRAFNQKIEDSIYGIMELARSNINYEGEDPNRVYSYHEGGTGTNNLPYALDRIKTNYDASGQLAGYREEIFNTQIDGSQVKTTTDTGFEYLAGINQFGKDVEADPGKILKSVISSTTESPDGSQRSEISTISYEYENSQLVNAIGKSEFNGEAAPAIEYTDAEGHVLIRKVTEETVYTYSYTDLVTGESVIVPEDQVIASLSAANKFSGSTETQFEILYGKPLNSQTRSLTSYYNPIDNNIFMTEDSTTVYTNGLVNNLVRMLTTQSSSLTIRPLLDPDNSHGQKQDIATTYVYDEKGNLIDAGSAGTEEGYEYSSARGWTAPYTGTVNMDYDVVRGKALIKTVDEEKTRKQTIAATETETEATSALDTTFSESSHTEYEYDDHLVATSATGTSTAITTISDDNGQSSTTTTVSTNQSAWKGGSLKIQSSIQTSDTTAIDGSASHSTATTTYEYNELGQLMGLFGETQTTGNGETDANGENTGSYASRTLDYYIIKSGQALRSQSITAGTNNGVDGTKTSDYTQTVDYEYILVGGSWEISSETTALSYSYINGGSQDITKVKTYTRDANGVCSGITQTGSGTYIAVNSRGGITTYQMQNYAATFVLDPEEGWYLEKEGYDWKRLDSVQADAAEESPLTTILSDVIHAEYMYDSHGNAISSSQTTTTTTTATNDAGQSSTTTTVSTNQSAWKGGSLKIQSSAQTSDTTADDGSKSHSASTTAYEYNELGQIKGTSGQTQTTGNAETDTGGQATSSYASSTVNTYIIRNGQTLVSSSETTGTNYATDGTTVTSTYTQTTTYEYSLVGGGWETSSETSTTNYAFTDGGSETKTIVKTYTRDANGVCTGITQTGNGTYNAVNSRGGTTTYQMQNYVATFAFDPEQGWYLQEESYDWKK
jgi:hypothetical protein